MLVAWKNLLSGRALTLSCTYRAQGAEWRLLRARVDEGTHLIRVSVTGTLRPWSSGMRTAGYWRSWW